MIGSANALNKTFDVLRGTDLNYQVDVPPIDTKVQ